MPAQYALRPVRLSDLPALKWWRSFPDPRRHLRHPDLSWLQHLTWWWGIRSHTHPTQRAWAVVNHKGELVGQAGLYYKMGPAAEVSVLVLYPNGTEDWESEWVVVQDLLIPAAKAWGIETLWAEVLATAPLMRHNVFPSDAVVWADSYSTIYRWRIA